MRSRTRYLLIGAGLIAFAIIAPAIVFYVRGLKFDLDQNTTLETGIISIITDPEDANIFLDDELVGESSKVIRFVEAGDHTVKIEKPGFMPWSKRLVVEEGKVTQINGSGNKLFLWKAPAAPVDIDSDVNSFALAGRSLLYTAGSSLARVEAGDFDDKQITALPKAGYAVKLSGSEHAILKNGASVIVYSFGSNQTKDLSSVLGNADKIEVLNSDLILALEKGTLAAYDANGKNKQILFKNTLAFTTYQNSVYAITAKGNTSELLFINTEETLTKLQQLSAGLPILKEPRLYINKQKSLYALSGGTLYRLGNGLETVSQGVSELNINENENEIIFATAGELNVYNPDSNRITLVSRNSTGFHSPVLRQDLGFAFAILEGKVTAIELDSRDRPNTYTFAENDPGMQMFITADAEQLFVLKQGRLQGQVIR